MKHRFRRWRIALRKVLRRIVFSRSSANSVAWGVALGVFIGFTPTAGFQMILAAFFAMLFGVNRLAAILAVWVSNPATLAPIYYFNFRVGALFLPAAKGARVREHVAAVAESVAAISVSDLVGTMGAALGEMGRIGFDVLVPLVAGSVIAGAVAAAASYPLALWTVGLVRRRRRVHSIRRAEERLERLEREGLHLKAQTGGQEPIRRAPEGGEPEGSKEVDEARAKVLGPIGPAAERGNSTSGEEDDSGPAPASGTAPGA